MRHIIRWGAGIALCLVVAVLLSFANKKTYNPSGEAEIATNPRNARKAFLSPAFYKPGSPWPTGDSPSLEDCAYIIGESVPTYQLHIEKRTMAVIDSLVERVMKRPNPVLTEDDRIWVKAKFQEGSKTYPVKVRLRGDLPVHWKNKVKSWRVRFPKDNLFHGIRELNCIIPSDRAYSIEAFGFHLARSAGLLTLRDGFAQLSVNSDSAAMYYIAENPTSEFLEASGRAQSAIFRKRDIAFEYEMMRNKSLIQAGSTVTPEHFKNYVQIKDRDQEHFGALDALMQSRTPESLQRILDLDKYATLDALSLLVGTRHCLGTNNVYLYYDDTIGIFEPILWDINIHPLSEDLSKGLELGPYIGLQAIQGRLAADPAYRQIRNAVLWRWVQDDGKAILSVLDTIQSRLSKTLPRSQKSEAETIMQENRQILKNNISMLKREMKFVKVFVQTYLGNTEEASALHMVRVRNGSLVQIRLAGIEIDGTLSEDSPPLSVYWDANRNGRFDSEDRPIGNFESNEKTGRLCFTPDQPLFIGNQLQEDLQTVPDEETLFLTGGAFATQPGKFRYDVVNLVSGVSASRTELWDNVASLRQSEQYYWLHADRDAFLQDHTEFQKTSGTTNDIRIPAGTYVFQDDVVIPPGINLNVSSGTLLQFAQGVSLFCYGSIQAIGTKDAPVIFEALENGEAWGVVAIVGPHDVSSKFQHVRFSNFGEDSFANTFFSGGLSVHQAEVEIDTCVFSDGMGEDALNLKRARGIIRGSVFERNPSDAIDLDWSPVPIVDCDFRDNSGDAIDVSGTASVFRHNRIFDCGDKGISIGEQSNITLFDNYIEGCPIGVAVKDFSRMRAVSCTWIDNDCAVACYQKKPVFGGGNALVAYSVLWNNFNPSSIDPWSKCVFQQCVFAPEDKPIPGNINADLSFQKAEKGGRIVIISEEPLTNLNQEGRKFIRTLLGWSFQDSEIIPVGYLEGHK